MIILIALDVLNLKIATTKKTETNLPTNCGTDYGVDFGVHSGMDLGVISFALACVVLVI